MIKSTAESPASLPWIEKLIRFNTTSRDSNLALIDTVVNYFSSLGIAAHVTYNQERSKANVFATIPTADGSTDGGIVFSGHTDTVPVDGQQWDSDPFEPVIRDKKLFGRGTCDMKGFIGVVLTLVPQIQLRTLKQPVHFAFTYDEERGCLGAPSMIEDMKKRGLKPSGCLIGEPTSMRPIVAHKGINGYRCCVRGKAAHSSLAQEGVNAIEYAARLICFIRNMANEFREQGPFDEAFDVPFTTAQTGVISGGLSLNIIPDKCEFSFQYRNLPSLSPDQIFKRIEDFVRNELEPEMQAEHVNTGIDLIRISGSPAMDASEAAAITQLVRALTRDSTVNKVSYGTEGGLFETAGIPAVICGPGSIQQAHKPNEFVALEQIYECEKFVMRMVDSLSVASPAAL